MLFIESKPLFTITSLFFRNLSAIDAGVFPFDGAVEISIFCEYRSASIPEFQIIRPSFECTIDVIGCLAAVPNLIVGAGSK